MDIKIIAILVLLCFLLSSCASESNNVDDITISDIGDETQDTGEITDGETDVVAEEQTGTEDTSDTEEEDQEDIVPDETTGSEDDSTDDEAEGNSEFIEMEDLKFKPATMTVQKGTTVRWIHNDRYNNDDQIVHQVALYRKLDSSFYVRSGRMMFGDRFNYTFTESGDYWYMDIIFKDKMRADIHVD